jgi:DNA-binding transcriptional LysR family regulator
MNDLNLRDLDAFVAVARTRNFRRAAREQRVSASRLSQRLRDMEERLGVRLMHRTTRSVALAEAGQLLLARVGPAITDIGEARRIRCRACAMCRRDVREAIKSVALVSVLDDGCAPFPGPFLYDPSRRQPPPALAAFVAFVVECREQAWRRAKEA